MKQQFTLQLMTMDVDDDGNIPDQGTTTVMVWDVNDEVYNFIREKLGEPLHQIMMNSGSAVTAGETFVKSDSDVVVM
jgi:hypothetical protein